MINTKKLVIHEINDLQNVYKVIINCGKYLHDTLNLSHWYPYIPYDQFEKRVKKSEIFGIYSNGNLIGTFTLSFEPRSYYVGISWRHPNSPSLYIGNIAIKPEMQGCKIGRWCMQKIEEMAYKKKRRVLRLDCIERHPWLSSFYQKIGYKKVCTIDLSYPTGAVVCFEKLLD